MMKFFLKREKNILKASLVLGFFTILAQILGLWKNQLLASHFGASKELDIYFSAFKIPDILHFLIGGMVVSVILIPIFTEKEKISLEAKYDFMGRFFNNFLVILILVLALFFFLMPQVLKIVFPAYQGEDFDLILNISRWLLLSPLFLGIATFFQSVNHRNKIFLPLALTGIVYNLGIIFGILFLSQKYDIYGVVYGVILGTIFYLLLQLPSVIKFKLFEFRRNFLEWKEFKKVISNSIFRSIILSATSLIIIYIYSKLSHIGKGLVTIFTFAFSVYSIPVAVLNQSLSIASLPSLAKFYSQNKVKEFNQLLQKMISQILFLSIPLALFSFFFSDLIVASLFVAKKFNLEVVQSTSLVLKILSLGIIFQSVNMFLAKAYYSMNKVLEVFKITMTFVLSFYLLDFGSKILLKEKFSSNEILIKYSSFLLFGFTLVTLIYFWKISKHFSGKLKIFEWWKIFKMVFLSLILILMDKILWNFFEWKIEVSKWVNFEKLVFLGIIYLGFYFLFFYWEMRRKIDRGGII